MALLLSTVPLHRPARIETALLYDPAVPSRTPIANLGELVAIESCSTCSWLPFVDKACTKRVLATLSRLSYRRNRRTLPLLLIDASDTASGKTCSPIARRHRAGKSAPLGTKPERPDKNKAMLLCRCALPLVLLDNVGTLQSDALDAVLTGTFRKVTWRTRKVRALPLVFAVTQHG